MAAARSSARSPVRSARDECLRMLRSFQRQGFKCIPRAISGGPGPGDIVAGSEVPMLLSGKRGLVLGIANKRSIAWGIAQAVSREGARLAVTYQGERLEENVRELAQGLEDPLILPCDVARDEDIDALMDGVKKELGGLDFVVHAVAYALREELDGEFLNTSREGYR